MIVCFLSNISVKYYKKNPSMLCRVIAKNVGVFFWDTVYNKCSCGRCGRYGRCSNILHAGAVLLTAMYVVLRFQFLTWLAWRRIRPWNATGSCFCGTTRRASIQSGSRRRSTRLPADSGSTVVAANTSSTLTSRFADVTWIMKGH